MIRQYFSSSLRSSTQSSFGAITTVAKLEVSMELVTEIRKFIPKDAPLRVAYDRFEKVFSFLARWDIARFESIPLRILDFLLKEFDVF